MPAETIPVVLLFNNVAPNSNLNITFTSRGATWGLGALSGDSLGFSYNVVPDDSDATPSCIQAISFNDSLLSIQIAANAPAASTFTLTLSLNVEEGVQYLQGYCTMNSEAVVQAFFGNGAQVQWRNGRISAVLVREAPRSCGVLFSVSGCKPGAAIELEVDSPPVSDVVWTLGPEQTATMGLTLYSTAATPVPLTTFSYTRRRISLVTASGGGGGNATDFGLVAFLCWRGPPPPYVTLKGTCDPNVSIIAQVGNRQPQYVGHTQTLFTL